MVKTRDRPSTTLSLTNAFCKRFAYLCLRAQQWSSIELMRNHAHCSSRDALSGYHSAQHVHMSSCISALIPFSFSVRVYLRSVQDTYCYMV